MRILIADDDLEIRSALRFLFEQEAEMEVVADVKDAPDLLLASRTSQPDLVVLDWELPSMGRALLSRVHAACPRVRVVALSGRMESRQSAFAAGADAFVSKSDPPEKLLATIRHLKSCPHALAGEQTVSAAIP